MRQLKYYLDTSVWNFLLEIDRPEQRAITERFFQQLPTLGTALFQLIERVCSSAGTADG